jgi:hypothetical protein
MTTDLEETLERLAAETMPFYRIPGLAIAVVRNAEDAAAAPTARPLGDYAGAYRHGGYGTMQVAVEGDALAWSFARWSERLGPAGADGGRAPRIMTISSPHRGKLALKCGETGAFRCSRCTRSSHVVQPTHANLPLYAS